LGASEWQRADEQFDESRYFRRRYVAVDQATQQVLGYGVVTHIPWVYHPQKLWLDIDVHPAWQRRGLGTLLLERLLTDARGAGMVAVWADVREDKQGSLQFLVKRGFLERRRSWELGLSVDEIDMQPLVFAVEKATAAGFALTTMEQEQALDPACYGKLYELANVVGADVPLPIEALPTPYEDFVRWLEHLDTLRDGYFIAKAGGQYVGFSYLNRVGRDPEHIYIGLTGVRREYRRLGIALALKVKGIEYAKQRGYKRMVTWNDSTNAAMLAVNLKLGFRYQAGWVTLVREV
jgi:GNAT superfamily N-acetyltransferase